MLHIPQLRHNLSTIAHVIRSKIVITRFIWQLALFTVMTVSGSLILQYAGMNDASAFLIAFPIAFIASGLVPIIGDMRNAKLPSVTNLMRLTLIVAALQVWVSYLGLYGENSKNVGLACMGFIFVYLLFEHVKASMIES